MPFANAWAQIQNIPNGTIIPNWTAARGYHGNAITLTHVNPQHITFNAVAAENPQVVPQNDFANVYNIWNLYIQGQYDRNLIRDDITRYSRYIINTFQWLCVANNGHIP